MANQPTDNNSPADGRKSSIVTRIEPASFYGPSLGSSHTAYIPPGSPTFREPELVADEPVRSVSRASANWGDPSSSTRWDETGPTPWDADDAWTTGLFNDSSSYKIPIDGRNEDEELNWSNPALHATRPGPGILPPILSDLSHDPSHALYSVSVGNVPALSPNAPTIDEARTAIPHPNAYFCREHNGWILLSWRSSSVLPPLVHSFDRPLPDMARRKRTSSCLGDGEQPFGKANVTHHWHRYEQAVESSKLSPPFVHKDLLLDMYLCCQCSTYCLVSDVIPGVIPPDIIEKYTHDRFLNPPIGKTPKAAVLYGWETVLTIIHNRLWKNETRPLPVLRPRFQTKVGWNPTVRQIFDFLDFYAQANPDASDDTLALQPPSVDDTNPAGKAIRLKLLRAWVEISAWLAIYNSSTKYPLDDYVPQVLYVKVDPAREMFETAVGAHVNQIPRGVLPSSLLGLPTLEDAWRTLGLTPESYTLELLLFAYLAQCRCDPARTMVYFTHLNSIAIAMMNSGASVPPELQTLIINERNRFRHTPDDYHEKVSLLGFGRDNELRVELDAEVDDGFIAEAWRNARKRAWRDPNTGTELRMKLNDALRYIADERNSELLRKVWEEEKGTGMSPDAAYKALDVPDTVDDTMLLTVFSLRVEDAPGQAERMREALSVIADVRDSERLHQYLKTGTDPGEPTHVTASDMPRGLNQLGNTCYLNSLLQYFYTVRDLRLAIGSLAGISEKSLKESKFTDDELKRHRVGGRLVTRREIVRSKRFVHQLAELFWNLEYCDDPAVTPSIDLAKLALVTSQDEEEEDQDHERTGTDSSNDTDATLVEDAPPRTYERSSGSPELGLSATVLGKRHRDLAAGMDVDPPVEGDVLQASPVASPRASTQAVASSSKLEKDGGDVEMIEISKAAPRTSDAPALPARKPRPTDDSVMMFGRQHDVSECMDNCMFQIETALLDFQEMVGSEDDKTSVVKRLFYGKKRQRLTALTTTDESRHQSSIHEKEDLFSHLHVNVADEGFDVYDGLARYFDDVVELEGQKKRMEVTLVDLPPLLQIQLQRVQFNRETQQAYKSQAYVKFGETIYMDRFLDSASPEKRARSKAVQSDLTASRDRVQKLTQGKHAPFAASLGTVADFLSKQQFMSLPESDEELVTTLRGEESALRTQIEEERAKAVKLKGEIEDIWKDDREAAYELTSVFIHRGSSPSWGHYFFYSRHLPEQPDWWFKYNDSDVSKVSKEEVLADTTGSTANPYMLVFARKGCEAIETVHRFDPSSLQDG